MKNKIWAVLIVAISLATILFFFYEIDNRSDNPSANSCGGINRQSGSETLGRIYVNNSDFQNLTKGNYSSSGGIFNETGESVDYIRINGWYIHEITIKMQNGTLKTIGPDDSLEDLYTEAGSLNGSVTSVCSQITGGELYMITIDTPNKTVKSIEKVDKLPEWITGSVEEAVPDESVY